MHRGLLLVPLACTLAACGSSSPTEPSSSGATTILQGQTLNAVDGTPASSVAVQVGRGRPVTTDGNGHFDVDVGGPGSHETILRGSGIVERRTMLSGPTGDRIRLSLIPASFDLGAFDEMFRSSEGRLTRWMARPSLVVLGSVMAYRNGNDTTYEATSGQLPAEEVTEMIAHLTEGLGLLTGNSYTSFASVTIERPSAGTRVSALREGQIVVGRYDGIVTLANTIGYGLWSERGEGVVSGGAMFLDRDFDQSDARRRLLRIHELGHALGYLHVRSRTSIMNPSVGPEPTAFDRQAAVIAFQRPPGNRAPDTDPMSGSVFSATTGAVRVMPPIYCR
jgi:hypothetical protein